MANNIMVERETFESHGKEYYSYFIKGVVRGKEIKIQVAPPNKDTDKNGYNVLDVVFGDAMEAELVVVPYEMKDDVYECPIKPARTSDKSFMNMLLR